MNWYPVAYFSLGFFIGVRSKFEYKPTTILTCQDPHCRSEVAENSKCDKTTYTYITS